MTAAARRTYGCLDPAADRYLRACVAALGSALGGDLIGAYLYSSAVLGDYVVGRSDVDVVAVVRHPLGREVAVALADRVRAVPKPYSTKGLDLYIVTRESAASAAARPRVELHYLTFYGEAHTAADEPLGDDRVNMHFACCRDHGIAVVGPSAREVFAPVPRTAFLQALARELNRAWMPAHYTILNACRDLRFVAEDVICSKVAGGIWAGEHGYDRWLVDAALSWQVDGVGPVIDGYDVDKFAAVAARSVTAAMLQSPPVRTVPATARPWTSHGPANALSGLADPPSFMPLGGHDAPLVSCVLVSDGDEAATARSAGWYAAQEYPARELLVVAPTFATASLRARFAGDPTIRVVPVAAPGFGSAASVGAARDTGCAAARGTVFALWELDTWYAPWRLAYQLAALVRSAFDTSAATSVITWDPSAGECWPERSTPLVGSRQLAAASVCLTRAEWRRRPFAARASMSPEAPHLLDPPDAPVHVPRGAHFAVRVQPGTFTAAAPAARYTADTIDVLLGPAVHAFASPERAAPPLVIAAVRPTPVRAAGERPVPPLAVPAFATADGAAIDSAVLPQSRAHREVAATWAPKPSAPLVTCIMPTFNRRRFIAQARRNFERQDYPNLELVVIDDGIEPIADLLDGLPNSRYVRLDARKTIGYKRNIACELAHGEIVVQWDDDDWYGPHRVTRQVMEIVNDNADTSAIGVNLLLDVRTLQVWSTREREAADPLFASIEAVAGGTLAYRKDLWRRVGGYPDASIGEDVGLLQLMADAGARVAPMSNQGAYVYIRHGRNSWRYDFDPFDGPPGWNPSAPPPALQERDLAFYASLRAPIDAASDPRPGSSSIPADGVVT